MRFTVLRAALFILTVVVVKSSAEAQASDSTPPRVVTAAEDLGHHVVYSGTGVVQQGVRIHPQEAPFDTALLHRTNGWLTSLQSARVQGIQLDAFGQLFIAARQDATAQQQFAARLATPGLSVLDSAYTLLLATKVFGRDARDTTRLALAQQYLTRLDALPVAAIVQQFNGHVALAESYDVVGNARAVIAHLRSAFALVPAMSYGDRIVVFNDDPAPAFLLLANNLIEQPNGRAQIDSIGQQLLPFASATRAQIAADPDYGIQTEDWVKSFTETQRFVAHFGRPAPALAAMYWYNTTAPSTMSNAAPGARAKSLNDGKVRVIEFGRMHFGPAETGLTVLHRMRAVFGENTEFIYATETQGYWGYDVCTPEEEAQHLRRYYVDVQGVKLPIALWAGPKYITPDGGSVPMYNPSPEEYDITKRMDRLMTCFIVIDGQGIVRHIVMGDTEDELERRLTRYVRTLLPPTS